MNKPIICGFSLLLASCSHLAAASSDPTAPEARLSANPSVSSSEQAVPKLSLIRQEGKVRMAVLDGQQRRVGAMHGQYKVLSIGAGTVIVAQGQRQLTLQLFPPMKK